MTTNNIPLVSILIPYYNHNNFIQYTLNSILEDTYQNKEIIIINDGSTIKDDSNITKWIDKHKSKINIKYMSRKNLGVTKTLNELISLSSGKYILLCASDDYLINDTISHRISILEKNPSKLMLLSDAIVVDNNNNKLYDSSLSGLYNANLDKYTKDDGLKEEIIKNWSVAGATHLINKELYNKVGLYNENMIVEDFDFFLRVVAKNYILFYNQKVSAYRQHDTNVSNDKEKEFLMKKDILSASSTHIKLFDEPYKGMLENQINYYKAYVKKEESFLKKIQKKTKKARYKIKNLFKRNIHGQ